MIGGLRYWWWHWRHWRLERRVLGRIKLWQQTPQYAAFIRSLRDGDQ